MESNGEYERLLEKILGNWPDGSALLWSVLLYLTIVKFTIPEGLLISTHAMLIIGPILVIVGTWVWSRRIPKTPKNKLGFGIAIEFETADVRKKVESDFVDELRSLIGLGETGKWFELLQFKQHIARTLGDEDSARTLRDTARLSFLIFGTAKIRRVNAVENVSIKLRGFVSHAPIPGHVQAQLQDEFSELFLPGRVLIPEENDLLAFEFTSQWASVVAKYIVGIALLVSNQFDSAETIFLDLQQLLARSKNQAQSVVKIQSRLPRRLAEVHLSRALSAYHIWKDDKTNFLHIQNAAEQINGIDDKNLVTPDLLFLRSLCHFLLNQDTNSARNELKKIKGSRNSVWYYNMGFLYAYDGSMKKATHMYRQGAMHEMPGELIAELEHFMCWVLENDPSKYQIHYCIGLLNQNLKGDNLRAAKDYEMFLKNCDGKRFSTYQELAQRFIDNNSRK